MDLNKILTIARQAISNNKVMGGWNSMLAVAGHARGPRRSLVAAAAYLAVEIFTTLRTFTQRSRTKQPSTNCVSL
jgi:hypothetical protein